MTSRDFCYWLQGFFEINDAHPQENTGLTREQRDVVQHHLAMVFIHEIDPSAGDAEHQAKLNAAHNAHVTETKPALTMPPGATLVGGPTYRC